MLMERLAFRHPREVLRQPVLRYAYALPVILFGWVMFRSLTVSQALDLWLAMIRPLASGALDLSQAAQIGAWQNMLGVMIGSLIFFLPGKISFGLRLIRAPMTGDIAWLNTGYAVAALAIAGMISLTGSYSPFLYFRF
jgi:hypothetical protein